MTDSLLAVTAPAPPHRCPTRLGWWWAEFGPGAVSRDRRLVSGKSHSSDRGFLRIGTALRAGARIRLFCNSQHVLLKPCSAPSALRVQNGFQARRLVLQHLAARRRIRFLACVLIAMSFGDELRLQYINDAYIDDR